MSGVLGVTEAVDERIDELSCFLKSGSNAVVLIIFSFDSAHVKFGTESKPVHSRYSARLN